MMKTVVTASACAMILLCAGNLWADEPALKFVEKIKDGGSAITLTTPYPTSVDWNNDGKKDLVIGNFYYGNIYLYLNQGTDLNPVFNGSSLIESGGVPITTSYG